MKKFLLTLFALFFAINIFAQQEAKEDSVTEKEKSSLSETSEKLEQDFKQLGQDFAEGVFLFGDWVKDKAESVTADIVIEQTKLGIVAAIDDNVITLVGTDGKEARFVVGEEAQIKIQDAIEGIKNPFVGGKESKFSKIKKGDWIQISYEIKDLVKSILPDSSSSDIVVNKIDILR